MFRLAGPFITTGHFDLNPGELRLKAYESRVMNTFLAVCLRSVWVSSTESQRSVELQLCLLLASQMSNWSAALEQSPIDLSREQALRLHADGIKNLITN